MDAIAEVLGSTLLYVCIFSWELATFCCFIRGHSGRGVA